jgi:8-oxo-dGTP pyrophosphatase MutT (NUDIX family)
MQARKGIKKAVRPEDPYTYNRGVAMKVISVGNGTVPYRELDALFPNMSYRAGMIVFAEINEQPHVLFVKQCAPSNYYGFPKGAREPEDYTARDTATRELMEETGIDATAALPGSARFVVSRWPQDPFELFIYFSCFVHDTTVTVDHREIIDYLWVPMSSVPTMLRKVSVPTAHVLQMLLKTRVNM